MNSYLIWIPSKQKYFRFKDLSFEQYKSIYKIIDDSDVEFSYLVNTILKDNIIESYGFNVINDLTIMDRFIIFVYLKIYSCNSSITLSRTCPKCETVTDIKVDLVEMLNKIAPYIDQDFSQIFEHGLFKILVDIPTIKRYDDNRYDEYDKNKEDTVEKYINNYINSHIKTVYINDKTIYLQDYTPNHVEQIIDIIPAQITLDIKNDFLNPFHKKLESLTFVKSKCKNATCEDELRLDFNINNINDLLKIIFKDNSLQGILMTQQNLCSNGSYDYNFFANSTPLEVEIIHNYIRQTNTAQSESPDQESPPSDMFDLYRQESKGMAESPSEFR